MWRKILHCIMILYNFLKQHNTTKAKPLPSSHIDPDLSHNYQERSPSNWPSTDCNNNRETETEEPLKYQQEEKKRRWKQRKKYWRPTKNGLILTNRTSQHVKTNFTNYKPNYDSSTILSSCGRHTATLALLLLRRWLDRFSESNSLK